MTITIGLKNCLCCCVVVVILIVAAHGQVSRHLHNRIPKPDPKKYHAVQDLKDWKNPYLIVQDQGIQMICDTIRSGQLIPVELVPKAWESLPISAWPYGSVVVVQESGPSSKEYQSKVACNRKRLLDELNQPGITAEQWP